MAGKKKKTSQAQQGGASDMDDLTAKMDNMRTEDATAEGQRKPKPAGQGKKARREATVIDWFHLRYPDNKLACWQAICRDIGLEEGTTLTQCKKILKSVYYNIFDFVNAMRQCHRPKPFGSAAQLRNNIVRTNRYFPLKKAKANPILQWMLINVK